MDRESRGHRALPELLEESLLTIASALDAAGITWLLTGSTMRVLRGFDLTPSDLDIEVGGADAASAALALGVPPPGVDADAQIRSLRSGGRARGVELDLTADLVVYGGDGRLDGDFAGQLASAAETTIRGQRILLAPIEEALARADALGDRERRGRLLAGAPPGFTVDEDWVRARLGRA